MTSRIWVHWATRDLAFALAFRWHVVGSICVPGVCCRRCGSYTSLDWLPVWAEITTVDQRPCKLRPRTCDNTLEAGRGAGSRGFNRSLWWALTF